MFHLKTRVPTQAFRRGSPAWIPAIRAHTLRKVRFISTESDFNQRNADHSANHSANHNTNLNKPVSKAETKPTRQDPSNAELLRAVALDEPWEVLSLLAQVAASDRWIPDDIMEQVYLKLAESGDHLATHLFARLVTVQNLGAKHFPVNCGRVVQLYLALNSFEVALAFIRDIELANRGELVLPYSALEALIISAKWHNDGDIGLQALQALFGGHPSVFTRTWGMALQLALSSQNYDAAKWIHRNALVPGYLVVDDASYFKLAQLAAAHGDLHLCEWASLIMRRRQRALKIGSPEDSLKLYVCLIEAAARASQMQNQRNREVLLTEEMETHTQPTPTQQTHSGNLGPVPRFSTVCRYLTRLGTLAAHVDVSDLPLTIKALQQEPESFTMLHDIFIEIGEQSAVRDAVRAEARTLILNLLLHALLTPGSSKELVAGETVEHHQLEKARQLALVARDLNVSFNEGTILEILTMAYLSGHDAKTLEALTIQSPTPRVLRRSKVLREMASSLSN